MRQRWGLLLILVVFTVVVGPVDARVLQVEVERRTPVLDGASFGPHGAYELVRGTIVFAVDPAHPRNQVIVDLSRAPRDSRGRVRTRANFAVLQPVDPEGRRDIGLVEVSNRGETFSLSYFNRATAALDPDEPDAFGDGLLMEKGITMIWVGWQWDVPREGNPLRLEVPIARAIDGSPIGGTVRSDWVPDDSTRVLSLAHRNHVPYTVADVDHSANVLTVRDDRGAPRRVIPRDEWRFARVTDDGAVVPDSAHVYRPDGFAPGKIYEAVYWARHPRVVGLGLAALRDVIAYAKHDADAVFPVDEGIAVGGSQTGRLLRHFLAHTPADDRPKTVYVNTGYEYWGRAASLIHTTPDGTRDVAPLPNERIYHLASTQHFPWRFPPPAENELRRETGLLRRQPPRVGPAYPSLVSQVDSLGNERAGVRNAAVRVPLATYTPWNLCLEVARNRDEPTDFFGSFVPLPRIPEEKARTGDPRPAIATLYEGRQAYLGRAAEAADTLIARGFLLTADHQRVLDRAERLWDWIMANGRSSPDAGEEEN